MDTVCQGCGAPLQSSAPDAPGYVPESARTREHPVCRRCYRIAHYGDFTPVSLTPEDYERVVRNVLFDSDTVLYVLDVFDLEGSLVPILPELIDEQRVVVALNKVDVLPEDVNPAALVRWVRRAVEERGTSVADIVPVSGVSGWGIEQLMKTLFDKGPDGTICVVGMANVGKSTLLNQLTKAARVQPVFTTSRMPGTTLGVAAVVLDSDGGRSHVLIDTPGLINGTRATDHLCKDCLEQAVPALRLRPRVFQLDSEQTLFLGGFARLDFNSGPHQPLVCYVSNDLVIHRTKLVRADSFYRDHAEDILVTPCATCRRKLTGWTQYRITTQAPRDNKTLHVSANGSDIVLAGLGWVSLFGGPFEGVLHAPEGLQVTTRPRLVGELSRR
ncbi:ribosome biogenesis GTPase YqeH [Alicyclobacillus sp. ALC3]|uniref:ribosome biogenesis GTPase YqeH n=1 Tax=Alicyclobacillus sp. ALC3 TaxID=2796143 RepID=UPI0023781FDF|nr:ribosome biogenesis GTPase YqeH [Alicyclobacillus sp. ALC3]WDL96313.1 ribosome biogenesis GTPase YqeH [Alicyclobacillus sp. ALC3]